MFTKASKEKTLTGKQFQNKKSLSNLYPLLAREYSAENEFLMDKYTEGSGIKVYWKCSTCGNQWKAAINTRTKGGHGCPYCSGRKRVVGVNDLMTTHPELSRQWFSGNKTLIQEVSSSSKVKVKWVCLEYGEDHIWEEGIADRVKNNSGCVYCSGRRLLKGFNDLKSTHPELSEEWFDIRNIETISAGMGYKADWKCRLNSSHIWKAVVGSRARNNRGCPYCAGQKIIIGENDLEATHPELAIEWDDERDIRTVSFGMRYKADWKCFVNNDHKWKASVQSRANGRGCSSCWIAKHNSKPEEELAKFIASITTEQMVIGSRSVIPPQEVDIYLPGLNYAIEFNGNYWHSDTVLLKTRGITSEEYHKNKILKCFEKECDLVFVWEDDWEKNKEDVKLSLKKWIVEKESSQNFSILKRTFSKFYKSYEK